MLRLLIPPNARRERLYVANVLFGEFLGLDAEIFHHNRAEVVLGDGNGKRLVLDDSFFADLDEPLVRGDKVPSLPLDRWVLTESGLEATVAGPELPVLFGKRVSDGKYITITENEIHLGVDVLGSAFFMLTRYEELVSAERDRYDRFPATASVAFKADFLERPIVNEYVEVLWQCLKRLWNGLLRRKRSFRLLLSHDVDQPFLLRNMRFAQAARTLAGTAFKRRRPLEATRWAMQWVGSGLLGRQYDPAYTFGYIMEQGEQHGLRSAFYFIPSRSAGPPDYRYGIHDADIQNLMSEIHAQGHEMGYHASLETYRDAGLIRSEVSLLRDACEQINGEQPAFGSRQHYLRVKVPVTLRYLADAGLAYDTTLGYADHSGFRCGTCWEYPFYDLERRNVLPIKERPLIVMECSVCDPCYMGMGTGERALEFIVRLADLCRRSSGDFTLLWHNTRLVSSEDRRLFEAVLGRLATKR